MALMVSPKLLTPLSTKHGTWFPGTNIDTLKVPSNLLKLWLEQKIVVSNDAPTEALEIPTDDDCLTGMTRSQLLSLIRPNDLTDYVKPTTNWSDEQIRQGIRDCVENLANLKVPDPKPEQL